MYVVFDCRTVKNKLQILESDGPDLQYIVILIVIDYFHSLFIVFEVCHVASLNIFRLQNCSPSRTKWSETSRSPSGSNLI